MRKGIRNSGRRLAMGTLSLLLAACATGPTVSTGPNANFENDFPGLMEALEGRYENSFQVSASPEPIPHADLVIRRVQSEVGDYLLADLSMSHSDLTQSWMIRSDRQEGRNALALQALTTDQLAMPSADLLFETTAVTREECLLAARWSQGHLVAVGPANRCRYAHPLLGELAVNAGLDFQDDQLTWRVMDGVQELNLVFERMARYQVKAEVFIEDEERQTGAWEEAVSFILSSDGQSWPLVNRRGQSLGFKLKLVRALWQDEDRPDLELQVLQAESGMVQALSRAERGAEMFKLDEPWVKLTLERDLSLD